MTGGASFVEFMGAVEGDLDEAVVRRLVEHVGAALGPVHGKKGKPFLLQRLAGFNAAAAFRPWVVLVDLDQDADCPPPFAGRHLPSPAPGMCFRVAVRAVEAWLLADAERIAAALAVPVRRVPDIPEQLDNPKQAMVDLARSSRRRATRHSMIPGRRSGRTVGPLYNSVLTEYVSDAAGGWRPDVAARRSESLARCIGHLARLAESA